MACRRAISIATRWALALGCAALTGVACGDGQSPTPDGGQEAFRLEILVPPGDAIGLAFNESIELRVRYSRDDGRPLRDRTVDFSIVAVGVESVGGSALSATRAETDRDGIAKVELVAGAEGAGFRVAVAASQATQATFYVSVSDQGFTRLRVEPVHLGPRSVFAFSRVDVRLYRPTELQCPDADPDALPESLFPPRSVPTFGQTAEFVNVASNAGYTVVAWATVENSSTPLTFGCLELGASQTRNFDVELPLVTQDRPVRLNGPSGLTSTFDLNPVLTDNADAQAAWAALACPLGPGQLLVDCVADALVDDGQLDCDFQGTGALADKIRAERGSAVSGCRPPMAGGSDSLDQLMHDAVVAGGTFPTGAPLDDVLAIRQSIASTLVLRSEIEVYQSSVRHRLLEAELGPGPTHVVDLQATARPLLEQQVSATIAPIGSAAPTATIAHHGFTLDYGNLAGAAFTDLALTPETLDPAGLGADLSGSAASGMLTGCEAVSDVFCTAVAEPATCAELACADASSHLDAALQKWWQLAGGLGGIDFEMAGEMSLRDSDNDLIVDSIGRDAAGEITGSWSATAHTEAGPVGAISGAVASP